MCNPNSNCRGVTKARVPNWNLARNGTRFAPGVTLPFELAESVPFGPPGAIVVDQILQFVDGDAALELAEIRPRNGP